MKRRNADCGKIRRPIKRNKITEGMYGSTTVLYLKFLILWAIVITADFMFMFRFEFLWPFWLLLRSVHDSFKYKGLAFSVLFVCIAITSDLVCLFFIPVHWLLFAASTYVWVQYVWHTDKGICLPTIILWMLFVYLEAGIRWKDSRHMPHLDLCRPFAAHCIGYPVVTLGFGFKSYIGYRMRQRKQREVAKENEFYMQLLQQALPQDETISSNSHTNTDDVQQSHQNGGLLHGNTTSGQLLGAVPVAQQVQITQNSSLLSSSNSSSPVIVDHHSNNHYHHTTSDVQIGQMSSNTMSTSAATISSSYLTTTTTVTSSTASSFSSQGVANSAASNHSNHNNLNNINSSSSSRNAQTTANNKLNNLSNNSTFSSGTATVSTVIANGHLSSGNYSSKTSRRNMDKDNKKYESNSKLSTSNSATLNNYHEISKDTKDSSWTDVATSGMSTSSSSSVSSSSSKADSKENMKPLANGSQTNGNFQANNNNISSISIGGDKDTHHNNSNHSKKSHHQSNGNVLQYEIEEVTVPVEPPERTKGRKNRSKRGDNSSHTTSSKDNHHNSNNISHGSNTTSNNNNNNNNNNNSASHHNNNSHHHHNNIHHSKDSHGNSDSSSNSSTSTTSSAVSSASATITNLASQIVTKICDTCFRLEAEVKKYRTEISHMKQIENELRQKLDSNVTTKSCLQAKQRECDDLDKRLHEMQNIRQIDLINLQNAERRLGEERRQRQSLEAQLNNEKKARKTAEEKATRPECSEACKQRKQQIENELKQLRRELKAVEDAKQAAEQQGRKCEQELRMLEAEVRNREAQQNTERLISALAVMQDKNSTLEKNLSAETRVKLDLFSALGEAKRQLEIKESLIRNKEEEVLDLKAKIAQLLAIMPSDSLCLSPPCSTTGPSSPMLSLSSAHQQIMASNHPLNSRGGPTSVVAANNAGVVVNGGTISNGGQTSSPSSGNSVNSSISNNGSGQNTNNVVSNANNGQTSSNLDPNATAYTPKNSMVSGAEA